MIDDGIAEFDGRVVDCANDLAVGSDILLEVRVRSSSSI